MLAKLACGINKPNKQTILPMSSVDGLFATIDLKKMQVPTIRMNIYFIRFSY